MNFELRKGEDAIQRTEGGRKNISRSGQQEVGIRIAGNREGWRIRISNNEQGMSNVEVSLRGCQMNLRKQSQSWAAKMAVTPSLKGTYGKTDLLQKRENKANSKPIYFVLGCACCVLRGGN